MECQHKKHCHKPAEKLPEQDSNCPSTSDTWPWLPELTETLHNLEDGWLIKDSAWYTVWNAYFGSIVVFHF